MIIRTDRPAGEPSESLKVLGEYSTAMAEGNTAAFYDLPPSGERVTINGTAVLRLEGGKIVEHWGGPHCPAGLGVKGARR